jgi:hypothetical protein
MPPHHSEDPHHWDLATELRTLGLHGAPLTRRQALRLGLLGAAGLFVGSRLAAALPTTPTPPPIVTPRARSVIQIWLWGGPSHLDTFDPKPDAGAAYCGPLTGTAATNVAGIRLGELLPLLARQADKYALIRSLSHGNNSHETAAYLVQTGQPAGRDVFPGAGAVVSLFKGYDAGYRGLLPPYIVLTELQGRFSEAGFLGARHRPFATGGDPGADRFLVEGVIAPDLDESRQRARRDLLHQLNSYAHAQRSGDPSLRALARCEDEAYEMILGDAGKVFDLSNESTAVRERYGRNTFGQSCLMARRLVEKGVPYVTINYKGWDTHKQHFQQMRRKLPEFDRGLATLLEDLAQRGLLDSTIVWAGGEFGRTPKVLWEAPWNGGRGHYGKVFSTLVAGGGFRGGQVIGASDAHGEEPASTPIHPSDLIARIYGQLGIAPDARLPHPEGLVIPAVPAGAGANLSALT